MCQDIRCIPHTTKAQGYTLIEIMISIVFMGVIVLSLSHTFSQSLFLTGKDQQIVLANNTARRFLRDTQMQWRIQSAYDMATLPEEAQDLDCQTVALSENLSRKACSVIDGSTYQGQDDFSVEVISEDIHVNKHNDVIIRKVSLAYRDSKGAPLVNIYYDFSRPGTQLGN